MRHHSTTRSAFRSSLAILAAGILGACASSPAAVDRPAPPPVQRDTVQRDTLVPPTAQALPPARSLVQRHLEAIGGRDAVLAPRSVRSTGRFEVPSAGLSGELEVFQLKPNRVLTRITIPNMGVMQQGFDGERGWATDPMTGGRLAGESEARQMRDQATWTASVRDAAHFTSMETLELTEMGGRPCYMVRLVWRSGRETRDCYGVEDGRLVGSIMTQESPMGTAEVRTVMEEYRRFGNVMYPTRLRQSAMGMEQIIHLDTVEFDVVREEDVRPPSDVRALISQGS